MRAWLSHWRSIWSSPTMLGLAYWSVSTITICHNTITVSSVELYFWACILMGRYDRTLTVPSVMACCWDQLFHGLSSTASRSLLVGYGIELLIASTQYTYILVSTVFYLNCYKLGTAWLAHKTMLFSRRQLYQSFISLTQNPQSRNKNTSSAAKFISLGDLLSWPQAGQTILLSSLHSVDCRAVQGYAQPVESTNISTIAQP